MAATARRWGAHPPFLRRRRRPDDRVHSFFVGGNWKMNGSKAAYAELLAAWKDLDPKGVEVVIGAPACYLEFVRREMRSDFALSAQNVLDKAKGAFTGEISPDMAKDCGATWSIIGHSERRELFGDSNEVVGAKTAFCLASGLKVMACVGEKKEEREAGTTMDVVSAQLAAIAAQVTDWTDVVIAYEPVWAIGTGLTATPEMAQETHKQIRAWLASEVSPEVAAATRILYGGSVKPANAGDLAKCEDIDGFLVGGASLQPSFTEVIAAGAV